MNDPYVQSCLVTLVMPRRQNDVPVLHEDVPMPSAGHIGVTDT